MVGPTKEREVAYRKSDPLKTQNPRLVSSHLLFAHMKSTVLNSNFVRGTVGI